jgi:RNA polymerase sigma-70 factor (ECF subfamily)
MVVSDNGSQALCPFVATSVSTDEARPPSPAAKEVSHGEPATRREDDDAECGHARGQGDGAELLRTEGEGGVLRGGGEGGMLRAEPAGGELRLPLATEAVWNEFHGRLRAYVGRRVRAGADVDDIVQKVFLQIHRGLPRLRGRERVAAWVFRTAHNAVVDHYRSPSRRREMSAGGTTDLDTALAGVPIRDGEDASDSVSAATCLRPVVSTLRGPDRDAIEAIELRGLTQKEAAQRAGVSLTAMKARVQRARRRLKTALLECCEFVLDARGGVLDCASRGRTGRTCGGASNGKECHDA